MTELEIRLDVEEATMRTFITIGLAAVLGLVAVQDASAWPFRNIWEKRRAELYAELSRDVSRRVNDRVEEAKGQLEASLSSQVANEAATLRAQARDGAEEMENLFDQETKELEATIADQSGKLVKGLQESNAALERKIQGMAEAELRRIEERSAAELDKIMAATERRIGARVHEARSGSRAAEVPARRAVHLPRQAARGAAGGHGQAGTASRPARSGESRG